MVFSNRPSSLPQNRVFSQGGPLNTETLTEENLLIKDQNHPDTAAMMPSMWPLGWQDSIPAWTWVVPSLLFSRKDGEVGVKETKLRLAGRAGFNCNFMSLHLRALLKHQCKRFIFWVYFQNIFDYWEKKSPFSMFHALDQTSQQYPEFMKKHKRPGMRQRSVQNPVLVSVSAITKQKITTNISWQNEDKGKWGRWAAFLFLFFPPSFVQVIQLNQLTQLPFCKRRGIFLHFNTEYCRYQVTNKLILKFKSSKTFFLGATVQLLTGHCVVNAGPVLTAVSFQPYSDSPVEKRKE